MTMDTQLVRRDSEDERPAAYEPAAPPARRAERDLSGRDRGERDDADRDRTGRDYDARDRHLVRAADQRIQPRRDALGVASGIVGLAVKLTFLAILLALFVGLLGLIGVGGRTTASVGDRVGAAFQQGVNTVGGAYQRARDAFDPAHPPRVALAQDTEIDELSRPGIGQEIAGSTTRTVALASVQRREGAESPDTAVYATLKTELRTPDETKILGMTVRSSRDPREQHLYRGETFRLGNRLYKVNWVSIERQQMAITAYREQDRVTAPVKFAID